MLLPVFVSLHKAVGGGAAGVARATPLFVAKAEGTLTVQHCYLPGKNILDLSRSNKLLNHQKAFTQSISMFAQNCKHAFN